MLAIGLREDRSSERTWSSIVRAKLSAGQSLTILSVARHSSVRRE